MESNFSIQAKRIFALLAVYTLSFGLGHSIHMGQESELAILSDGHELLAQGGGVVGGAGGGVVGGGGAGLSTGGAGVGVDGADCPLGPLACKGQTGIKLYEPFGGPDELPVDANGVETFLAYFNLVWPWMLGVACGVAVFQALLGGYLVMISGGDSTKREMGKSKFQLSVMGLLMIAFAGLILTTLNSIFFVRM